MDVLNNVRCYCSGDFDLSNLDFEDGLSASTIKVANIPTPTTSQTTKTLIIPTTDNGFGHCMDHVISDVVKRKSPLPLARTGIILAKSKQKSEPPTPSPSRRGSFSNLFKDPIIFEHDPRFGDQLEDAINKMKDQQQDGLTDSRISSGLAKQKSQSSIADRISNQEFGSFAGTQLSVPGDLGQTSASPFELVEAASTPNMLTSGRSVRTLSETDPNNIKFDTLAIAGPPMRKTSKSTPDLRAMVMAQQSLEVSQTNHRGDAMEEERQRQREQISLRKQVKHGVGTDDGQGIREKSGSFGGPSLRSILKKSLLLQPNQKVDQTPRERTLFTPGMF